MYAGETPPSSSAGDGNYIIATEGGARMTSKDGSNLASIYASNTTCHMETRDATNAERKCYLNLSPSDGLHFYKSW